MWIDHNTFYPANDGSVDVKRGSDLVTVSYNRYVGTDKSMLLGHSDSNGAQDTGYLRVTYHHNWFDGSNTRHPRVRFGYAHVFANYVNVDDYFIGLGVGGQIYAESNYVRAHQDHHRGLRRRQPDLDAAATSTTSPRSPGPTTAARPWRTGCAPTTPSAPPPYSYSAGSASTTPPAAGAGVSGADTVPR